MKKATSHKVSRAGALIGILLGLFLCQACDLTEPVTVTITSPKDGDAFDVGETITFSGTASARDEGELSGDALVWETNGDDGELIQLGTGNSFTRNDLAEGFYVIFLTATNSKNEIGMEGVGITVGDAFADDDNETAAAGE